MTAALPPELAGAILDQVADALVYADRQGTIAFWNRAAEQLFGYPAGEALGQSLDLIIPERLRPAHWKGYHLAIAEGRTRNAGRPTLTKATHRSGASLYVHMTFAVVADDQGRAVGSVAMARPAEAPKKTA